MKQLFNFEDEALNNGFQIDMKELSPEQREHVLQMFESREIKWASGVQVTEHKYDFKRDTILEFENGELYNPVKSMVLKTPLIDYPTLCRAAVQLEPNVFSEMLADKAFKLEDYARAIGALGSFNGCTLFRSVGGMVYKNTFNETLPTISPQEFEQRLKGIFPVIKDCLTTEKPKYFKSTSNGVIVECTGLDKYTDCFSGVVVHQGMSNVSLGHTSDTWITSFFEPCDYTPNEVSPETEQPKFSNPIEMACYEVSKALKEKDARIAELEAQLAEKNEQSSNTKQLPVYDAKWLNEVVKKYSHTYQLHIKQPTIVFAMVLGEDNGVGLEPKESANIILRAVAKELNGREKGNQYIFRYIDGSFCVGHTKDSSTKDANVLFVNASKAIEILNSIEPQILKNYFL